MPAMPRLLQEWSERTGIPVAVQTIFVDGLKREILSAGDPSNPQQQIVYAPSSIKRHELGLA